MLRTGGRLLWPAVLATMGMGLLPPKRRFGVVQRLYLRRNTGEAPPPHSAGVTGSAEPLDTICDIKRVQ